MSMFYCFAHEQMEDSDYVGIVGMASAEDTETCDTLEGAEYRSLLATRGVAVLRMDDLTALRALRLFSL